MTNSNQPMFASYCPDCMEILKASNRFNADENAALHNQRCSLQKKHNINFRLKQKKGYQQHVSN